MCGLHENGCDLGEELFLKMNIWAEWVVCLVTSSVILFTPIGRLLGLITLVVNCAVLSTSRMFIGLGTVLSANKNMDRAAKGVFIFYATLWVLAELNPTITWFTTISQIAPFYSIWANTLNTAVVFLDVLISGKPAQ